MAILAFNKLIISGFMKSIWSGYEQIWLNFQDELGCYIENESCTGGFVPYINKETVWYFGSHVCFRLWLSNLIYNFCLYSDTCQEVLDCPKLADFRCVQVFCKAFLSQISYGFNVYDFFITSFLFFFREVFCCMKCLSKNIFTGALSC